MKKVMKKFNRALSIMLVAAMVLTMAPQTAMPVLAATEDPVVTDVIDEIPAADSETVVEEPSEGPETEDEEVVEVDNETPVIEEETTSEEDAIPEPEQPAEEPVVLTGENETKEITTTVDTEVLMRGMTITPAAGETPEQRTLGTLANAEIEFTKSCASADGKTVRADKNLTFFVLPKDGYRVTAVWYALGESEEAVLDATKAETLSNGTPGAELSSGAEYSLPSADIANKKVLVAVQTEAISYTVAAGTVASGVTVNVLASNALTAVGSAGDAAKVGYTGSVKLCLAGSGIVANPDNYTVEAYAGTEGAAGAGVELTAGTPVEADAENSIDAYVPYTLDVTKLTNRNKNTDQNIAIRVTAKAALNTIATSAATVTPAGADAADQISVAAATIKTGVDPKYGYVAYATSGTYTAGQQVAFQVNRAADSNYAPVEKSNITAKLSNGTPAQDIALDVNDAPRSGDVYASADTATAYVVALPSDTAAGYTLKIEVKAELAETVAKTITFKQTGAPASAGQAVTIKTSEDAAATPAASTYVALAATNRVRTEGDFIWVDADPKEGYELAAINVTVTGSLNGVAGAYTNTYVLGDVKGQKSNYPTNNNVTKKIDLKGVVPASDTEPEKPWIAKTVEVEVVVSSEAEGADEEKTVTFDSVTARSVSGTAADGTTPIDNRTYAYPYGITEVEGQVTAALNVAGETEVTVAEGTAYLQFYVDAPTDPTNAIAVTTDGSTDGKRILELVSKSGDRYTYRVPAKLMRDDRGTITITRPAVDVTTAATYAYADVTLTAKAQPTEDAATVTSSTSDNADLGAEVELIVEHVSGQPPIKAVTYTVAGGAAQTAAANAEGDYVIDTTATGNIVVTVESGTEENIYVQSGSGAVQKVGGSDPVEVDYDKVITAWLGDHTTTALDVITNAVLTDAETGKLAQTEVNINTTTHKAEITIDESEYAKVLTVTLIKNDRTKVSFQIVSDEAANAVSYSRKDDGSEVKDTIELAPGTRTELNVTAAGDAAKLHYAIVPAGTEVPETSDGLTAANDNMVATYTSATRVLSIKANARVEKLDDAGTIVFWADGSNKILAGSALKVTVSDPVVKSQTATIREAAKTGRMVVLQFSGHEAMKNARLVEGAIGYMVKMTLPTERPAGVTADQWTAITTLLADYTLENGAFVGMSALASDGSLEIPVVPAKTAGGEDIPPLQISGIKVKATPVQFIDAASVVDAATANTAYATEANRAIGTASEEIEISTAEAKYSDTLKMNGGSSTVLTNSNAEVSVGSPVLSNNAKNMYVYAEIIDSSTGLAHDYAGNWSAYYNAGSNQVIVKSNGASYAANAAGLYKNLAVKVTAFTEDGDYGASMAKKLSVNNGIGDLHVSVQPEILKQNNKKVTVKPVVTFNTTSNYAGGRALTAAELGKRAPKNKAVVYSLVLPAKLQGKVEINSANGQITINDYVPTGSVADNTFRVRVDAVDKTNTAVTATSNEILITSTEPAPGRVAVLEVEGRNYKEATGDLQVKDTYGQYIVAMIKSGVVKDVYTDADLMDLTNYTVKASNAKSFELYTFGNNAYNIKVNKLGKCSFTFTAKSLTKKKAEIKNVNFVAEKTDLYAQVIQYYDSTFETAKSYDYYKAGSTITANDNTTNYFSVRFMKKVDDGANAYHYEIFALGDQNTTVSFKNAKKVTPKVASLSINSGKVYFAATGSTGKKATVITITNKMVKPATKFEITINNETADKVASTSAPKIAQNDKKQVLRATGGAYNVVMDVTPGKKTDSIGSGRYIMLSVDQTKKYKADPNDVFDECLDTPILLSHKNDSLSQFTLKVDTEQDIAESYTINAAIGTMDDGVFKQEYKESKFVVKTVKASANIKVNAKYTLNPYGISKRQLVISSDYQPISMRGNVDGNYAQNQILKTGEANKFTRYFEVRQDINGTWWIGVKENLPANILAELSDPKSIKDDLTGYITVTNGEKLIDVKLTVDLKTKEAVKFTAKAVDVIAGTNVVTDIKIMDGKEPVALAAYQVTAGSSFKVYYNASEMDANPDLSAAEAERLANGIIRVTAASASKGTDTVTLNILPAFMADTLKVNADENKPAFANGYQVAAKINVKEGKTTGNKIDMAAADKNWIVASSDWKNDPETVDGSVKFGWEKVNVPYSFKTSLQSAEVSKINVTSNVSYVEFASDAYNNYENEQNLTIFVNKAALQSAAKAPLGKAVTVKAKFEYANEAGAKLDIKADEVSFKITLPGTISDTTVDDFYKAVKAAAEDRNGNLKKLAESAIKKYDDYARVTVDPTKAKYATKVASVDLSNAIKEMAKGTSATFSVAGAYSAPDYTYTITVTGKSNPITITVTEGLDVASVKTLIQSLTDAQKAEMLTYNPMTTADQLVAALNEVLNLPNNITLSAVVEKETETPKALADGVFRATVTIVDNSIEPAKGAYQDTVVVSYTFAQLGDASTSYFVVNHNDTTNEIYGLATVLNKATNGVSKLEELFSNAESLTGAGAIDKDNVVSEDMVKALIGLIEEEALKALAKNSYLGVKGIDFNTFACDYDGTNSKWVISFKITYTDDTPGIKTKEVTKEVGPLNVVKTNLASQKTVAALQTAAETAFGDKIIGYVTTKEAAIEAIRKIVVDTNKNPNYDPEKNLKVTLQVDGTGKEVGQFAAPTTDMCGKIDVTIVYDANENTPAQKGNYTFTIAKATDMKEDDPTQVDPTKITARTQYKDRVRAFLTAEKVNEIAKKVWKDENAPADYEDKVATAIKTALGANATAGTPLYGAGTISVSTVTVEEIQNPSGSTNDNGIIKNIVITLADSNTTPDWGTDAVISIPSITLTGDAVFQSDKEFADAVVDYLEKTGLVANTDYDDAFDAEKWASEEDDDTTAVTTACNAIKTAITNIAKTADAAEAKFATNPALKAADFTGKVEVTVPATKADYKVTGTAPKQTRSVTGVTITFNKDDAAKKITKAVTLKVRTAGEMPVVEKVEITNVGTGTAHNATNHYGETFANPFERSAGNSDTEMKAEVKVEGKNLSDADKVITWKAEYVSAANAEPAALSELPTGVKDKVSVDPKTGTITIKKDAYGDDFVLLLTATAAGDAEDDANVGTAYVKISLPEDITNSTVEVKAAVTGESSASTPVVVAKNDKFEAPETSGDDENPATRVVTFTATAACAHKTDSTKAVFTKPADIAGKVTFAFPQVDSADDTSGLIMTITEKLDADQTITLPIKVGTKSHDLAIKVGPADTKNLKIGFTGTDDVTWDANTNTIISGEGNTAVKAGGLMTVHDKTPGKDVKIPLNITDTTAREWAKTGLSVTTATVNGEEVATTKANLAFDEGTGRNDKGQLYLVIKKEMLEVKAKQDKTDDAAEIKPCFVTITATSTAKGGQSVVKKTFTFELVVEKAVTGITITGSVGTKKNDTIEIANNATAITLTATVAGTHLASNEKDVTWEILNKAKGSDAVIDASGAVTGIAAAKDNTITVRATSKTDKSIYKDVKIKVAAPTT